MKISTKGRYGLEALLDMAINSASGHVNLKSIAERCNLSEAYILQLFLTLRKAGIIDSIRGAQGGYTFSKSLQEISVAEVLIALEGPLAPVECILNKDGKSCDFYENCSTRWIWELLMEKLTNLTLNITLADLVESFNSIKEPLADPEYFL